MPTCAQITVYRNPVHSNEKKKHFFKVQGTNSLAQEKIQGGPKVGIQYIVYIT